MSPPHNAPPPGGPGDARHAGQVELDIHDGFDPDPETSQLQPASRPGAPLSDALRQQAAQMMIEGVDWMENHWQATRWAGVAVAVGSLAFMLHYGHVSGWRQYASLAELPPRLLAPGARQLPMVLHSVAQRGDVLAVRAVHYPLLRRLADRYRGLPPTAAVERAAESGQLLTCHLAGPVQPTTAGLQYLRAFPLSSLHRLRLLSIVDAADQTWTSSRPDGATSASGATSADATSAVGARRQLALGSGSTGTGTGSGSAGSLQAAGASVAGAPGIGGPAGRAAGQGALVSPPEAGSRAGTSPASSAGDEQAAGEAEEEFGAAPATGPERAQQGEGMMLWGELYAREPRRGLALLLPRRRVDVGERLVAKGAAAMMEPIDLEWLGVSWERIDRLYASEQAAIEQGLGMWAQRRPGLGEWSASLARSAWMRVRHTARTSAAAAAGGLGSAASAAGGAVAQASSAAAGTIAQASSAAAGTIAQAAAAAKSKVARGRGGAAAEKAGGKGKWRRAAAAARRAMPGQARGAGPDGGPSDS